jgi:uncharacterized membrane protein HdeD (DUF308 family)
MNNDIFNNTNSILTGFFIIIMGIFTIIYPSLARNKWDLDEQTSFYLGILFILVGLIITIIKFVGIYKGKDSD